MMSRTMLDHQREVKQPGSGKQQKKNQSSVPCLMVAWFISLIQEHEMLFLMETLVFLILPLESNLVIPT